LSDKTASLDDTPRVHFARSATRHRISRESIRHVIAHHRVSFEKAPPAGAPGSRSVRLVYLGDDLRGQALEVMAIQLDKHALLVIHAMPLRVKYRKHYEEQK
jgi:hypothetical protein